MNKQQDAQQDLFTFKFSWFVSSSVSVKPTTAESMTVLWPVSHVFIIGVKS